MEYLFRDLILLINLFLISVDGKSSKNLMIESTNETLEGVFKAV
jgi:hypothetical protein